MPALSAEILGVRCEVPKPHDGHETVRESFCFRPIVEASVYAPGPGEAELTPPLLSCWRLMYILALRSSAAGVTTLSARRGNEAPPNGAGVVAGGGSGAAIILEQSDKNIG